MEIKQLEASASIGPGDTSSSRRLYEEARQYSPQGAQGEGKYYFPYPHFWSRGAGSRLWDVDGNEYVDYWCGAGPAVLGHNHSTVREAVKRTLDEVGVLFSAPYPGELELAKLVRKHVPSAEMSGFGCGGSDAIVFALRAARAHTGRTKIVRCEGSYHGWYDGVLFSVSPGVDQLRDGEYRPIPVSTGLPPESIQHVLTCPYNDPDALERLVTQHRHEIAAVILEPLSHTMGVIPPVPGFLQRAREVCDQYAIALVFDEVITGFRHHLGGIQAVMGVTPDLTAFGKAMSNGFPICAVSGRRAFMEELTPQGRAVFSGTYNGNPVCVTAALATIRILEDPSIYERLYKLGDHMRDSVNDLARRHGVRAHCVSFGSVWSIYFTDRPIRDYRSLLQHHDSKAHEALVRWMWREGFYTRLKRASRWHISASHSADDVQRTIDTIGRFFREHASVLR